MFWIELKAYHVGTFGGVYPTDPAGDPTRWVNMDRILTVLFEKVRGGTEVAKMEAAEGGTILVRDPQSIRLVREYLQAEQARRPLPEDP